MRDTLPFRVAFGADGGDSHVLPLTTAAASGRWLLDRDAPTSRYVPELEGTASGDARGDGSAAHGHPDELRRSAAIRCSGAIGDRQVVPEGVARTIATGVPDGYPRHVRFPAAPPDSPATLSYHGLRWILNDPHESFMADGIHGRRLLISPEPDPVIVHFASQVMSPSVAPAPLVPAFLGIGAHLDATT
ncbi:hypothetical protein ACF08M_13435 [Streptomyces sp. NPDC015032]|uniref:hypothetical protein n=1 Tax=Streptomyces sp. NPDC015032 TaxID=3364937 RepID=UPI0036FAC22B